jgi:hypothetical protein
MTTIIVDWDDDDRDTKITVVGFWDRVRTIEAEDR